MHFLASNNAAKYEALLHGVRITTTFGIHWLKVLGDSLLIVNQANKEWPCLDDKMLLYCQELHKWENNFNGFEYMHILQGKIWSWMSWPSSHRCIFARTPWAKHFKSFGKGYQGDRVISGDFTTKKEHNRVTWNYGNPFRLAHFVHDLF
jgi:hypothetical protein